MGVHDMMGTKYGRRRGTKYGRRPYLMVGVCTGRIESGLTLIRHSTESIRVRGVANHSRPNVGSKSTICFMRFVGRTWLVSKIQNYNIKKFIYPTRNHRFNKRREQKTLIFIY